jgi:release factor glutamine methyltransferase
MIADKIKISCNGDVYYPREDSYLLASSVQRFAKGKMLDLGTGSGIQGIVAAKSGCTVTFADINPAAISTAKRNAAANRVTGKFIVSDMFSKIDDSFNLISFNPPYLPSDSVKDAALDGGRDGRRLIDEFISCFRTYLKPGGCALLLESSFNQWHKDLSKGVDLIAKEHYFFEDLVVLRFR